MDKFIWWTCLPLTLLAHALGYIIGYSFVSFRAGFLAAKDFITGEGNG